MQKWLVCGLPAALVLGSACGGDETPGPGGLNQGAQCTMVVDPMTVGVGGDLSCVDQNVDTDGDRIPDVQEGTGDANMNGIPAHLDPDENTVNNPPVGGDGGVTTTGGTNGPSNPLPATSTPYQMDATGESGLDQATIDELKGGGGSCTHNMLYPYEGTIFPGGLPSPTIMWAENADAAYVHLSYDQLGDLLDFEYATGASSPGEMRIPQQHWDEIVRRTQNTPLKVKMTVKSGGSLSTCEFSWRIAPGNMIGSIYYNTYNHPEAGGVGAVVRLRLGNTQSELYQSEVGAPPAGPCRSCHSVSADGSTLVSQYHNYFPGFFSGDSYQLSDTPRPPSQTGIDNGAFGALTPNGEKLLTMGNPDCTGGADTFPRSANNFPLVEGPDHARLLDTSNGSELSATGLTADRYMWMAQFSPNGDKVVFNNARPQMLPDGSTGTNRRTLAWATFDNASNTFGEPNPLVPTADGLLGPQPSQPYTPDSAAPAGLSLFTTLLSGKDGCSAAAGTGALDSGKCSEPCYPAWPFFTPDGNGVIFSLIDMPDFMSAMPGRTEPSQSELWYVDLRDGQYVRLDNANKGPAPGDSLANYFPTVLPVQVGGYYWVFWTSTRDWGHKDLLTNAISLGFDDSYLEAPRKRIWVSAIRPRSSAGGEFADLPPLVDPSHPPFYLEGQGDTGNVRAFAALNPCLQDDAPCTSGLDCCSGYCDIEPDAAEGTCTPEPPPCARLNERCNEEVPCCQPTEDQDPDNDNDPPAQCLGGYCGFVSVL